MIISVVMPKRNLYPWSVLSNRLQRSSLFVFVHPCLFRYCGHGWLISINWLPCHVPTHSHAGQIHTLHCPFYPPATLCRSSNRQKKKKSLIASSNTVYLNEMPSAFYVRLFVSWPSFFHDCLCVFDCVCAYVPKWLLSRALFLYSLGNRKLGNKWMLDWLPLHRPPKCLRGK